MKTIQLTRRNRKNPERIAVSQIGLNSERYLREILKATNGLRLHSGLVEALLVERNIPVGVTDDLLDLLLLDRRYLLALKQLRLPVKQFLSLSVGAPKGGDKWLPSSKRSAPIIKTRSQGKVRAHTENT